MTYNVMKDNEKLEKAKKQLNKNKTEKERYTVERTNNEEYTLDNFFQIAYYTDYLKSLCSILNMQDDNITLLINKNKRLCVENEELKNTLDYLKNNEDLSEEGIEILRGVLEKYDVES